ncbi:beta-glucoside-specific PTS transporter subunit IIABC [Aerococcus loyolae]|uniref:Beta-glucoside-specific PTS transporter subunit IIABC n=1 Tax=Aerococcus loyolae TaxID=2976809 RepID=A0ABT4BYZ5_9LACT|nr:beta-glucoside-specific PTS transporter subunit IIABC [Aerococcus loyolae]MCY3024935.1 beta-glucoside-specific PTS transporter subunit IIABC [Aerococcus loyolae]MCY3027009.1 beta-glucoside-specific PTS transporter subunit IIABC [Aerococcus loyolae]MCY3028593.1 beta-glucoside-specific PTS transporter subunit IIABC [Aerococcus loyolae]OAM70547.1 PTS beta-glucoside transporter subunit EIIBCA [Aerococcus loyolae]
MAKDFQALAQDIIDHVGGEANIVDLRHCITRLRFRLRDDNLADTDYLKKRDGIVTVVQSSNQYQVVIGNDVPYVYEAISQIIPLDEEGSSETNEQASEGNLLNRFIDLLSGLFQPLLGALAATGIIKGIMALLVAFGLSQESGFYQVMNAVGDGFFQFLPMALAVTAARRFKLNVFVALAVSAAFLHPALPGLVESEPLYTLFAGTPIESAVHATFLGLPIILPPAGNYYSTVIPIIFAIWLASKINHWVKSWMPRVVEGTLAPVVTLLIATPVSLLVIGPIATWLSSLVGWLFTSLATFSPILFGALLLGAWQLLVIFGLHWGLIPIGILQLTEGGASDILGITILSTFSVLGLLVAIAIRSKEDKTKNLAASAAVPALFGITEPAVYGILLPMKKVFAVAIILNTLVGAVIGYFRAYAYTAGGLGIFALGRFIHPEDGITQNFWVAAVAMLVLTLLGLIAGFLIKIPRIQEEENSSAELTPQAQEELARDAAKQEILASPVTGAIHRLEDLSDEVFASGAMGKGIAIEADEGTIYAPSRATITSVFPTGHALGLTTENGTELLIHVGLDTVELKGEGFEKLVQEGDSVEAGQALLRFDRELIRSRGYETVIPIVVTNSQEMTDVLLTLEDHVDRGDYLLTVLHNGN